MVDKATAAQVDSASDSRAPPGARRVEGGFPGFRPGGGMTPRRRLWIVAPAGLVVALGDRPHPFMRLP